MAKWLIVIEAPFDASEDLMNRHAGNLAGRLGGDSQVVQVRKLEPEEVVKVVDRKV